MTLENLHKELTKRESRSRRRLVLNVTTTGKKRTKVRLTSSGGRLHSIETAPGPEAFEAAVHAVLLMFDQEMIEERAQLS